MHEMPFAQAILELAEKEAQGRPIRTIHLRVGTLSAIVPESLQVFFDYLKKGTLAEGAALVFTMVPIVLTCRNCGQEIALDYAPDANPRQQLATAFRAGCSCGRNELKLTGGLDCDMAGIEL